MDKYVTFDLSMLGDLSYYTGIVFSAYTYETGDAIVKGGRYDKLVAQFGKDAAAIGFSITVDKLMMALERQKIDCHKKNAGTMILYEEPAYDTAIGIAKEHRSKDMMVNMLLKNSDRTINDYIEYSKKNGLGGILYVRDKENLEIINASTEEIQSVKISDILK